MLEAITIEPVEVECSESLVLPPQITNATTNFPYIPLYYWMFEEKTL